MSKILNLDELAPAEERVIVLKGKRHPLKVMTVEDVIANARSAERLERATDEIEQFEVLIEMLARNFPTMPEDEWRTMQVPQLEAVFKFAQELGQEANEQAAQEAASGNAP